MIEDGHKYTHLNAQNKINDAIDMVVANKTVQA